MQLVVDLHSHSGHAGGVGNIALPDVAATMRRKGIDVYGTGDCLQPEWRAALEKDLAEREPGLFSIDAPGAAETRFLLQTEIIITADVPCGGRKGVHVVLLLPSFKAAERAYDLLAGWGVKLGMGRPFLKCADAADVAEKCYALQKVDEYLLPVPAHVLTPQGIYGSDRPVERMSDFFGEFTEEIKVIETGLSADPLILALIPELDSRTLLSNSDCHSAALNRVGREFTALEVDRRGYVAIIEALLDGRVNHTAEFTPAEGRYFLTGHRAGSKNHGPGDYCYFSPDKAPADGICPLCGKPLTIGVLQRALALSVLQGEPRTLEEVTPAQQALYLVPLVEVIAAGLGVKSVSSKKVLKLFDAILTVTGTEAALWQRPADKIERELADVVPSGVLDALMAVARDEFTFEPLGYDGSYGELILGRRGAWFGHSVVQRE